VVNASLLFVKNPVRWAIYIVALVFLGWGLVGIFWDLPVRAFLWDEALLRSFVENTLSTPWSEWTNGSIATNTGTAMGNLLLVLALLLPFSMRWKKGGTVALSIGSTVLFLIALLLWKEKSYALGQLLEQALQFGFPVVCILLLRQKKSAEFILTFTKVLVALTFLGHGAFALGIYPQPGHFIDMCIRTFGWTEATASTALYFFGWLDVVVALAIFVKPVAKYALLYAAVWGILTAFARVVAYWDVSMIGATLAQMLPLVLYRLVHGLAPLWILWHMKRARKASELLPASS